MNNIVFLDIDGVLNYTEWYICPRPQRIRYGQAIFNVAYKMYPNAVNKLRGTDLDCFYQDEKVDKFLNALENLLLK